MLVSGVWEIQGELDIDSVHTATANWFCNSDYSVQGNVDAALQIPGILELIFGEDFASITNGNDLSIAQNEHCELHGNTGEVTNITYDLRVISNEDLLQRYEECIYRNTPSLQTPSLDCSISPVAAATDTYRFKAWLKGIQEGFTVGDISFNATNATQLSTETPDYLYASSPLHSGQSITTFKHDDLTTGAAIQIKGESLAYGPQSCTTVIPAQP